MKYTTLAALGADTPPATGAASKFWSMAETGEDEAEIILYGEVTDRQPYNFFTGEPVPGMFITPEGFLEDLEKIKGKSTITLRINSGGGNMFTGMAIATQLKTLAAKKIGIVDGIAASAASLFLMACDVIKIPVGGGVMIHEARVRPEGLLSTRDLKTLVQQTEAANKAMAELYAERTGLDVDEVRGMMARTKWLIGQEAVDKGFATELLEGSEARMALSADRRTLLVAGLSFSTQDLPGIPDSIPVLQAAATAPAPPAQTAYTPAAPAATTQPREGGNPSMNETITTAEQLAQAYPALVAEIRSTAADEATKTERERIQNIDAIASVMEPGLVASAKYEKPCTAQELSFQSIQQQAQLGGEFLEKRGKEAKESGAGDVGASTPDGDLTEQQRETQAILEIAALHNQTNGGTR